MQFVKKKSVQGVIVVLLVLGIILAGTFAWFSFSQTAVNVFEGMTNPGGNLHDDFEKGEVNKDVYVENNGNRPIYVRVRFDEFMDINNTPLLTGDVKDDVTTWNTHKYLGTAVENCGEAFHDYYNWIMGSSAQDPDKGLKYYLPAPFVNQARFAKDGTQTEEPTAVTYADNNDGKLITKYGSAETYVEAELQTGKQAYDRIHGLLYDAAGVKTAAMTELETKYKALDDATTAAERKTAQTALDTFLKEKNLGYWDKIFVVKEDGSINNAVDSKPVIDYNIQFVPLRRTQTTAKIYTMAQWIAEGTPTGEFWIIDTDGWAYWGNILQPSSSTGLLLSEVVLGDNKPAGTWYYGINVKLQAVTYDDIAKFGNTDANGGGGITDQGMMVLQASSGNYVFDMENGKTSPNDPVYTFVNNKNSTFRLMTTDGTNTITYSPLFVYTGPTPPTAKGDIYSDGKKMGDAAYQVGQKFKKDIPFGAQGVEFTIVDIDPTANTNAGTGTGVLEGKDGKHYVKLSYQRTVDGVTSPATAWLAVGANKAFDKLTGTAGNMLSSGDDVLVWTSAVEPGTGAANADRFVEDESASYKIGDVFTKDGKEWVILGVDTKTGSSTLDKTLIISKNVLDTSVATADVAGKLTGYGTSLTELKAANGATAVAPVLLTIQEGMDYFANNAARVALDVPTAPATPISTKWWLKDNGIVAANGALLSPDATATDVGIRVAFWMDSAKVQEMLYPTTVPTP